MIIPGRLLIPNIIKNVLSPQLQAQPCGVDLSLRRIFSFKSSGTLDFDNSKREKACAIELPIRLASDKTGGGETTTSSNGAMSDTKSKMTKGVSQSRSILLPPGSYSVEFNETANVPLDMMGQIFPRSSLFRSGASITTGVVDSGYTGPLGGLLIVSNIHGIRLYDGAKLAQIVFHQMSEEVEGYSGTYQGKDFCH